MSLSIHVSRCTYLGWQNTWSQDLPASPPPCKIAAKLPLIAVSKPTMHRTESAHLHCRKTACRCLTQRRPQSERTATAEPPQISAESEPWASVVHDNRQGTRPAQQGHRPPGKILRSGVYMVFRTGKTMGIGLCTTGMSTTSTPCTTGALNTV